MSSSQRKSSNYSLFRDSRRAMGQIALRNLPRHQPAEAFFKGKLYTTYNQNWGLQMRIGDLHKIVAFCQKNIRRRIFACFAGASCIFIVLTFATFAQTKAWDIQKPRGKIRTIDFTTSEGTWMSVDISSDGGWVVFDLLGEIYRVSALGGDAECLTQDSGIAMNYHPRYSPDAKEIAFVSDRGGQDNLWIMDADGSHARTVYLDDLSRVAEPSWTADGRYILVDRRLRTELGLYRTNDRIWMFPREGGPGKLIAGTAKPSRLQGEYKGDERYQSPSPSPDGVYVYYNISTFAGDNRRIQRVNLRTRQIDDVTEEKSHYITHEARPPAPLLLGEAAPEVSPDGHWLAFARKLPGGYTSFRDKRYAGRSALWLRNLDTGEERIVMDPITNDQMDGHTPWSNRVLPGYSWTKDSRSIVISQGGKIRELTVATGEVKTIPFRAHVHRVISEMARSEITLNDKAFVAKSIRWPVSSSDGRSLVFEAVGQLWIMDLPNGKPRPLVSGRHIGVELTPSWSHDGKWVAFTTTEADGTSYVSKVSSAGGSPLRLTEDAATYLWPSWSFDDQNIVVNRWSKVLSRDLEHPQWELATLPANGGLNKTLIKVGDLARNGFGQGERIFFEARRPNRALVLKSIDRTGRGLRDHLVVGGFVEQALASPDGQLLALHWRHDIYLLHPPQSSKTDQPIEVDPLKASMQRLSREGGYFPHWRNSTTLEFVAGNNYIVYHTDTRITDKTPIRLEVDRDVPAGSIALTDAEIITINEGQVIPKGTVLIKGERIVCVGQCDTSQADRIVNLSGKTIIPGMIDMHAHNLNDELDGIIQLQRASSAVYLAYGVTTVRDPFAHNDFPFTTAEMIEAGRITGPRTYTSGEALICMDEGEYGIAQRPILTLADAEEAVNRQANWGAVLIKDYKLCTRGARQMVAEAVRERGLAITSEGGDLFYNLGLVMDGYTGWEHSLQYVPIYSDVSTFLGQAQVHHTPNHLISELPQGLALEYFLGRTDLWDDSKVALWAHWQETAARRIFVDKPLDEYSFPILAEGSADIKRAGGHIVIGDHGEWKGMGTNWEVWANAYSMSPMEALEAATIEGAHFLGFEKEAGSVEVGKLADLVILNHDPLVDIHNTIDIMSVMKAGKLYDGKTLDELWPQPKPYGVRPWVQDDILRRDVRSDDYWDKH